MTPMTPVDPASVEARAIARAICVDYRLSPEEYERHGGEHPIIAVIVRHVAPRLTLSEETARAATERAVKAEARLDEREEAHLASLACDIAREIESHDDFDCPAHTTYVRAANAIATRLVEKFGRSSTTIASLQSQVEAMREALEFSGRVMRGRPERSVADNLALAKTDAALAALGQKETDHG